MGSEQFIREVIAINEKDAFDKLCLKARDYELSSQGINSCSRGCCIAKYDFQSKSNMTKIGKLIEERLRKMATEIADYIDCGIDHYEVSTIKKVNCKIKNDWKLRYVVYESVGESPIKQTGIKEIIKKIADDKAIELALKNPLKNYVVTKEYVDISNSSKSVTMIKTECKIYKTKPKINTPQNKQICEMRKYIFFGWGHQ